MTLAGDRLLEIKCPYQGRESTLWKSVQERHLPEHYQLQVQHHLLVTKADIADVYIFDGAEGVIFPVAPDESTWPRIRAAWDQFSRYVSDAQAPPLTDRDTRIRDDPEWLSAAAAYLELRTACEELSAKCDEAKAELAALASHAREQGGGVSLSRMGRRGNIDYKRVPQLIGVDLESYRTSPREETRVSVDR